MKHLFLTGASGLLGSQLLARLLLRGRLVGALVRPTATASGAERIDALLAEQEERLGVSIPRPVVLEGELTAPWCGLGDADVAWMRRSCSGVVHSAASLEFVGADRSGDPWRTNVVGTRTLLELTARAELTEFHHVSTAYVCGLANGPVEEGPSTDRHGFRNDYEASKHEAEWLVRRAAFLDRPTFLRPAVIVGDSQTGATTTYHGLMAMLQLMTVIVRNLPADETGFRHVPLRLSMTGAEERNMVPVDWVAEAIARLLDDPRARGRTIHLAPRRPITIREIIDFTSSYLNSGGLQFCGPSKPADLNDTEDAVYAGKGLYEAYEQTDPGFVTAALEALLPELPCPIIDEAMIHRFLAYGDADNWGRRRRKARGSGGIQTGQQPAGTPDGRRTGRELLTTTLRETSGPAAERSTA
jgi:thioester reductase-like protein